MLTIKPIKNFRWELRHSDFAEPIIIRDITGNDLANLALEELLSDENPLLLLCFYDKIVESEGFRLVDLPLKEYGQAMALMKNNILDGKIMSTDIFLELLYFIQGQSFGVNTLEWFDKPLGLIMAMRAVVEKYPRATL